MGYKMSEVAAPIRFKRSIASQVVVIMVLVITVVLVIVSTVAFQAYRQNQWAKLTTSSNQLADQISSGMALAVWNLDFNQIEEIMASAMNDGALSGISTMLGDKVFTFHRDSDWKSVESRETLTDAPALITQTRDIRFNNQIIGNLKIQVTSKFLLEELQRTQRILIGLVVLLDLVLVASLYLLIWLKVLRPLQVIEKYANDVSSGESSAPLSITRPLQGEFGQLHESLKVMVHLLESRLEEVKESNERFWKLVGGFPHPLCIYELDTGKVIFANQKFEQILGYTADDVGDLDNLSRLVYPDEQYRRQIIAERERHLQDALQGGLLEVNEQVIRCGDGNDRIFEIGGVVSGNLVMSMFNDITQRHKAEQELNAYKEQLEQLVDQRTRELVEARDQAQSANQSKTVFLANMSHELRTPLNSVIGFSNMMSKEGGLTERQQRNIEIINRSGNHLLTLINDILELAKIDAGKLDLSSDPVDLTKLLREVADMLKLRAEKHGIELNTECRELPGSVEADETKLRQVLLNMVNNALKNTNEGEVKLIAEGCIDNDQVRVRFAVMDTGCGIRQEDQQRIFEPFVQADTSNNKSGTGLGLVISRQYVESMGGELTLDSTFGKGSTFEFTLDLAVSKQPMMGNMDYSDMISLGMSIDFQDVRVVVADDVAEVRALLEDMLKPLNMQVSLAADGEQALDQILTLQPHLVLLDWRMPGMDGLEVTRSIRANADIDQPKIIMLSASAYNEDRQRALTAGVDDFISKPVDIDNLYLKIEEHLGIDLQIDHTIESSALSDEKTTSPLTSEQLQSLSPDTMAEITEALRELNPGKINQAMRSVVKEIPQTEQQLENMVTSMQYRQLWQLFGILDD